MNTARKATLKTARIIADKLHPLAIIKTLPSTLRRKLAASKLHSEFMINGHRATVRVSYYPAAGGYLACVHSRRFGSPGLRSFGETLENEAECLAWVLSEIERLEAAAPATDAQDLATQIVAEPLPEHAKDILAALVAEYGAEAVRGAL